MTVFAYDGHHWSPGSTGDGFVVAGFVGDSHSSDVSCSRRNSHLLLEADAILFATEQSSSKPNWQRHFPSVPVWGHASSCACSSVLDTLFTIASYAANGASSQHAFCGARLKQLVPGHKEGSAVLDVWAMAQAFHRRDSARLIGVRIVTGCHHQTWSCALHVGRSVWMDGNHLAPTMLELDLKLCAGNFLHHHRSAFRDGVRAAREVLVLLSSDVVTSLQQLEGKGRHSIHALCC